MPQHQVLAPEPPVLDGEPSKPAGPAAAAAAAAGARPAGASAAAPGTTATTAHALHAFDVLCNQLLGGSRAPLGAIGYENATCPLFVSWHKASSRAGGGERLRGCIGTLEARPLHGGLRDYALTSALRDRRFPPIEARELPALRCTVSLLSAFEPAAAWDDWEVGTHGLIIEFADPASGQRRTATFLPEVAAHEGWDRQQTLDHLIRKAGYAGAPAPVRASPGLRVTRYRSTTASLTYEEYAGLKEGAGGEAGGSGGGRRLRLRAQQPLVSVSAAQ